MHNSGKFLAVFIIFFGGVIIMFYLGMIPIQLNSQDIRPQFKFQLSSLVTKPFKRYIKAAPMKKKTIVMVNTPGWLSHFFNSNIFRQCEISCEFRYINASKYVNESDAVIQYAVGYNIRKQFQRKIKQGQIWIFADWESAGNSVGTEFRNAVFDNMINWTMTYRLDSDISTPYGVVRKINGPSKNYTKILAGKEKLVAQIVSHCSTVGKREVYTNQLQQYLPLTVIGYCGPSGKRNNDRNLSKKIEKSFKFYMAFENSLCRDYISEKFFDWQNRSIVPIVRGGGNYEHFYPKNSYIDVRDFKSISDLADYIKYLDKNNTAYIEYLKAKENYTLSGRLDLALTNSFCSTCKMLQDPDKYKHVYAKVYDWFRTGACKDPSDLE